MRVIGLVTASNPTGKYADVVIEGVRFALADGVKAPAVGSYVTLDVEARPTQKGVILRVVRVVSEHSLTVE